MYFGKLKQLKAIVDQRHLEYTNLIVDLNQRHLCCLNHWIHCLIPLLDHVVIYSNIYDVTMEIIYWILPCGSYLNLDQI